ncbi:MAG: 4-phosphoerythronate dehydrogenase [Prevotella sp.]|jgi:erythronate-4-phosphate dehydrogenase|nr:4-phosphoerythronate dehydrogenase [Prevotella sp.]
MRIVADKDIPYLKGVAEAFGEVEYLSGDKFTREAVREADTLIVRTVTRFGRELLAGSNVKLICSATIGFDHIDTAYCTQSGIAWRNAPGCNSGSVMQYVVSALIVLSRLKNSPLDGKTIGVVGVGNVGKKVAKACRLLGMRVLLNDPPRQLAKPSDEFVDLETVRREADFITFHTPLTKEGEFKTLQLADHRFFSSLTKKPVIINTARGGIIDTDAIKEAIVRQQISGAIIDCWENEPVIDLEYMRMVDIATPHIAGYSADGKANASRIALENLCAFWHLPALPIQSICVPNAACSVIDMDALDGSAHDAILQTYNPLQDYRRLLANPSQFSRLRAQYPLRREYAAYTLLNASKETGTLLTELGFGV